MPTPYPLRVSAFTATSCLGPGNAAQLARLRAQAGGLAPCRFLDVPLKTWVGEVAGVDEVALPAPLARYDCRNNRLAELALRQDGFDDAVRDAVRRHGPARVAVFLGTSTSGMLEMELAYRRRDPDSGALPADFDYAGSHNTFSLSDYVRRRFGIDGPAMVISAACASGAKAFASARRAIQAGLVDAAVVGGVDSLCLTTLYGFNSLELLSPDPCRPYDARRDGISIAEAAAFALLERPGPARAGDDEGSGGEVLRLVGTGESSDAHHMSSPHPEGLGARLAMERALASAGLAPADVDYINLHGTATPSNDLAEDAAVHAVFEGRVPVSSTKAAHGHALGAAGALEAVIALLCLREGLMPAGLNRDEPDPALRSPYLSANRSAALDVVMSNSFGFGGVNASLLFDRITP
ncbi:MAG: beta-ketoacyl-[acyl-carrier-protein] synthase family protein [Burkholderiaceae bacterium]